MLLLLCLSGNLSHDSYMLKKLLNFLLSDQKKLVRGLIISSVVIQIVQMVLMGFEIKVVSESEYSYLLMGMGFFFAVPVAFFSKDTRTTLRNVGYTLLPFPISTTLLLLTVSLLGFAINLKQGHFTNPIKPLIIPTAFALFMLILSIVLPAVAGARVVKMALEYFSKPKEPSKQRDSAS